MDNIIFGVSPAFVYSMYGPQFTVQDFLKALDIIKELEFKAFQPEIFDKGELTNWIKGGSKAINNKSKALGLHATQFVAHFMHEYYSTAEMLRNDIDLEQLKQVIELVMDFEGCKVLTVPVCQFQMDFEQIDCSTYNDLQKRLTEKIVGYLELITDAGLLFGFEIVPFSIIGSIDRFLALCEDIGSNNLGINLDTGHAWSGRELIPLLPFKLKNRIFGLHLKDNNSNENLPLAPGRGTIDWKPFLNNLFASGYKGSLDIEIGCKPDEVKEEYSFGLNYLQPLVKWEKGYEYPRIVSYDHRVRQQAKKISSTNTMSIEKTE
ncbi:MAG: sugar phosphate isomerase/epimerase family protein [Planctomycetota bacterium]|jgi:sugar phosphate isomerase/epimerase